MIPVLKLLIPTLLIGMLVLLGAILEWLRPRDAQCLPIDPTFSRDDMHFAHRYREIARDWWHGSEEVRITPVLEAAPKQRYKKPILCGQLNAKPGCVFESEIWARQNVFLDRGCVARAVLSDGSIVLAPHCKIKRWVHSELALTLSEGCLVKARATSQGSLVLIDGSKSKLLSASVIHWHGNLLPTPSLEGPSFKTWEHFSESVASQSQNGTLFVDGDVEIGPEDKIQSPLVVRGHLRIKNGALLAGNIKAHGDIHIEQAAIVGNVIALGKLTIGGASSIQGCIRGDQGVWLGDGIVLGRPEQPVAVAGKAVLLSGSGTCFGRIKAMQDWVEVMA